MPEIIIYRKDYCPYCDYAKRFFNEHNLKYTEIDVQNDNEAMQQMVEKSRRTTVPQIFIDQKHIGGYDDLMVQYRNGELDFLLKD